MQLQALTDLLVDGVEGVEGRHRLLKDKADVVAPDGAEVSFVSADHFLAVYADKFSRPVRRFARAARAAILAYSWPGNVRELQHAIERSVIMSVGEEVRLEDLPAVVAGKSGAMPLGNLRSVDPSSDEYRRQLDEVTDERARISKALEFAAGNRERAADLLRISRTTLWRRMKAQGLSLS